MPDDQDKVRPKDEQAEFVLSQVDDSAEKRQPFESIWEEVEENFLVRPLGEGGLAGNTQYPFSRHARDITSSSGRAELKDPETHQEVMSIVAGIILSVIPEEGKFIHARRVGMEDVLRGATVASLMHYFARLPGHFMALVEWLMAAGIYGTGLVESFWDFIEEPRVSRAIGLEQNPDTGAVEEISSEQILTVPVYDDVRLEHFSNYDFFPDHSQTRIDRMLGATRRFKIVASLARKRAEQGIYDKEPVDRAIEQRQAKMHAESEERSGVDETGLYPDVEIHPDFLPMTAFRYVGQVPFKLEGNDFNKAEIVVLNGETVRSKVWPRRLPWFDCKITPRLGSFWAISPGELIRYDQDFADTLKMMLADAVVRLTHPPPIYNTDAEVQVSKLRAWKPTVPIGVRGDPNRAIGQPNYNPQLQPAVGLYGTVKQQMREATSALDNRMGIQSGSQVRSATESAGIQQFSSIRPELFNRVFEQDSLPPLGVYTLKLYKEHLHDTEDLRLRVGETNASAVLADILPDYDIEFVGTRIEGTKAEELASFREIIAAGSNPTLMTIIPWIPLLRKHFDRLGAHEIAAMVGNPKMMELHLAIQQLSQPNPQGGNQNGTSPSLPPSGAQPAQIAGGIFS